MKFRRAVVTVVVVASSFSSAARADWEFVDSATAKAEDGSDLRVAYLMDPERVAVTNDGLVKAWVKTVVLGERKNIAAKGDIPAYSEMKQLSIFNCRELTTDVLQLVWYDDKGNVLKSENYTQMPLQMRDVVPDTLGESWLRTACDRAKKLQAGPKPKTEAKPSEQKPKATKL